MTAGCKGRADVGVCSVSSGPVNGGGSGSGVACWHDI